MDIEGGTFVSVTGGTFETAMPGTFVSAAGGTFETVLGGTIKPLPSENLILNFKFLNNLKTRDKWLHTIKIKGATPYDAAPSDE